MAVRKLDCLSEVCPIPILRTIKEFKTMKDGDILILQSDHSCVGIDIKKWASQHQYPVKVVELDEGEWEIYIQKSIEK